MTEPTAFCSATPDADHTGCPSSIECFHAMLATDAPVLALDVTGWAGWGGRARVTFEGPDAERVALDYLDRRCPPYTGGSDYMVWEVTEDTDLSAFPALMDRAFPTCEHQMSAHLCMGPQHFPSAEQERALWG